MAEGVDAEFVPQYCKKKKKFFWKTVSENSHVLSQHRFSIIYISH
jgi:hypothetical protein